MGPKKPVSTVLNAFEEALIVVFRKRTRFPLDDCLARLKPMIPNLNRSALHRCLKRHGVSRVPKGQREKAAKVGDWHSPHLFMEIHPLPDEMGGSYLYLAFGDLYTFVFAQHMAEVSVWAAVDFLEALIKHAPVKIASIETSRHEPFADSPARPWNPINPMRKHPFRNACRENKIGHTINRSTNSAPRMVTKGWRGLRVRRRRSH
jgi:hypothetical protein